MLQVTKMLDQYKEHCAERNTESHPPLPLTAEQTAELTKLLQNTQDETDHLIDLITNLSITAEILCFLFFSNSGNSSIG